LKTGFLRIFFWRFIEIKRTIIFISCGCKSSVPFLLFTKLGANPRRIGDRLVWAQKCWDKWQYIYRTIKLRLSFYVSIRTISVRNKNVQTTVSQRLACSVFWNTSPERKKYACVFTWTSRPNPHLTKTLKNTLSQRLAYNVSKICCGNVIFT
jgi:hypothetical protein